MSDNRDLSDSQVEKVRNQVIEMLKNHYAQGNLGIQEFEERLEVATHSNASTELMSLVDDLPAMTQPASQTDLSESNVKLNTGRVKESGTILSILSGHTRKGAWRPPRQLNIFSMMGGTDLDFREAFMPPGVMEVNVFCLMGGVDIKVPPGLNVELTGFPIMGGFEDKTSGESDPGAPTLRIKGLVIMGGVEVKEKKKK